MAPSIARMARIQHTIATVREPLVAIHVPSTVNKSEGMMIICNGLPAMALFLLQWATPFMHPLAICRRLSVTHPCDKRQMPGGIYGFPGHDWRVDVVFLARNGGKRLLRRGQAA
jgi:hypothetical protein